MNQLEQNVIVSFRNVKDEVSMLRDQLAQLRLEQQQLIGAIHDTRSKENMLYNRVKYMAKPACAPEKPVEKPKFFIASKMGKNVHEENCIFAKRIRSDRKVIFDSKVKAIAAGFKQCDCMKAY